MAPEKVLALRATIRKARMASVTSKEGEPPKDGHALEWRPAPRPYVVSLASLIASSSVLNLPTDRTGPKISSLTCPEPSTYDQRLCNTELTIFISGVISVKTVEGSVSSETVRRNHPARRGRIRTRGIDEVAFSRSFDSTNGQLGTLRFARLNV